MFGLLLESGSRTAAARHHPGWMLWSTTVHATVIGLAVVAAARVVAPSVEPERVEPLLVYRQVQPVHSATLPSGDASPSDGNVIPQLSLPSLPTIGVPAVDASPALVSLANLRPGESDWSYKGVPAGAPTDGIFRYAFVERPATILRGGQPAYPPALRVAGVEGEVLVRFVVDTLGRVESGSIEIVRTSHQLLGKAVSDWLAQSRFRPAESGLRRVRQLVEQRVDFSLSSVR